MAHMLEVNILLAMAKDTGGLRPIAVSKVFLQVTPLSYSFMGCFKNTYPPINLEFRPLEVVRPSFLASEPLQPTP